MERLTEIVNGVITYIGSECHYSIGLTAAEIPTGAIREMMRKLAAYEDLSDRWRLAADQIDTILRRVNALGGTDLMAQYLDIGTVEELRALAAARNAGMTERRENMTNKELIDAVRSISVETGSIACLGCGWEHNCGIHGCAVLRQCAAVLEDAAVQHP